MVALKRSVTQKLLCVSVIELPAFASSINDGWFRTKCPTICSAFISSDLNEDITTALSVINDNNLFEVSLPVTYVNWFYSLDEKLYQKVNSYLNVRKNEFFFSGALHPVRDASFRSNRVPMNEINESLIEPRQINLSLLNTAEAKKRVAEIESLYSEQSLIWDRQSSLEKLQTSLEEITQSPVSVATESTDKLALAVKHELKELELAEAEIENRLNIASMSLASNILGISIGDRLYTQHDKIGKQQTIVVESIHYNSGTLFLEGPKILRNGAIGKRSEMTFVDLVVNDERY